MLKRLIHATYYSYEGLKYLLSFEFAFRLEISIGLLVLPMIYFLPATIAIKLILFILWAQLLIVETINSAIETIVNRISYDTHPLSKIAKDLGSTAVFLTILLNISVWFFVLIDVFHIFL